MDLLFAKSKWELPGLGLAEFLAKIKAADFEVSELYLPAVAETNDEVRAAHQDAGLKLVAQIDTGRLLADPWEVNAWMRNQFRRALTA